MRKLTPKELAVKGKRTRLLVDERFLRGYGLREVATRARERMIPFDEESFARLRDRKDAYAFEKDMATTSYLDKRAVMRILPFAVANAWEHSDGLVDLSKHIADYDLIHSFRLDPIILVMSAWLCEFNSGIDRIRKWLKMHPDYHPEVPYPVVENPDPFHGPVHERVQFFEQMIDRNRKPRATELLAATFSFGTNKNLLRLGFLKTPGLASSILYSFNRALAEKMMLEVLGCGVDPSPSFRQGIKGEAVVNAEDLADDAMFDIVFRMLYHGSRLTKVHVQHQGRLAITIDRRWLRQRIAGMRKRPGDFFALVEKFIPLVKASLGKELGTVPAGVQAS